MGCLGGTYTAFAMIAVIQPASFAGTPPQVLVPASILLPFFASFVAFVVFAPVSFGLYRLMERFNVRSFSSHCVAGVLCVALTLAIVLMVGYVASLFHDRPAQMEETGLFGQPIGQEQLFVATFALSGVAGGAAFYFARRMGISTAYSDTSEGRQS